MWKKTRGRMKLVRKRCIDTLALKKAVSGGAAIVSLLLTLWSVNVYADAKDTQPENTGNVVKENTNGEPFSIKGNGQLVDDAFDDDTKEFITVQTKNNQTYFVVIDRANAADNVYMLSMIDEDDLKEFLKDKKDKQEITDISELEALQDQQKDPEPEAEQEKSGGGVVMYIILFIAVCGILGGYYYVRIYKPRQEENEAESENLEQEGYGDSGEEEEEDDEQDDCDEWDYDTGIPL